MGTPKDHLAYLRNTPGGSKAGHTGIGIGKVHPGSITTETTWDPEKHVLGQPTRLSPPGDTLYAFLEESAMSLAGRPNLSGLNGEGQKVQAEFNRLWDLQIKWNNVFGTFQKNASQGQAQLDKVLGGKRAIEEASRGKAGEYLRNAVEKYEREESEFQKRIVNVGQALKAANIAAAKLDLANMEKDAERQKQEVEKTRDELEEERRRVEETKHAISEAFAIAAHMVEPGEWASLVVAGVTIVGEQVFEKNVPTDTLTSLRAKLAAAQEQLNKMTNAIAVQKAEIAQQEVTKAMEAFAQARREFFQDVPRVGAAHKTLVEALESSPATKDVGKAVEKRGEVIKGALEARNLINAYLKETAPFLQRVKGLESGYRGVKSMAAQSNNLSESYRAVLARVAEHNAGTAAAFGELLEVERALAKKSLAEIANPASFKGYDLMIEVLQGEIVGRPLKTP